MNAGILALLAEKERVEARYASKRRDHELEQSARGKIGGKRAGQGCRHRPRNEPAGHIPPNEFSFGITKRAKQSRQDIAQCRARNGDKNWSPSEVYEGRNQDHPSDARRSDQKSGEKAEESYECR